MRILHIPNYYNPHIGGIETTAEDIVHSLYEDNENVVICFKDEKKTVIDMVDGIKVVRVGCQTKVASQSIALGYGKELKKLMKEFKPEAVVMHYPNPFVTSYLMKYLKKKTFKFILYWHLDITKQKMLGKMFEPQTKKLLKYADKIVATSPNYLEGSKYLPEYKEKVVIIPSCISNDVDVITEDVSLISEKIKNDNASKTIVFALGRHVSYKGIIHLVHASKFLDSSFEIYIAGKGPLTDSLMEEAKDDKKVHFLGRVDRVTLKAYLNACDIFAFPSETKNEAFGLALAEAMALGKPSVTFTIPGSGVNYVSLNRVTGIEVPNSDAKAFADALIELKGNKEEREAYGIAAKERCNNLFRFSSFKASIRKLFGDLK